MTDHAELQAQLLRCVWNEFFDGDPYGRTPACEKVSSYVVRAVRPSHGGKRTDMGLFGVCSDHKYEWAALMEALDYSQGMLVEWSAVGELFRDLETMGYLKYVDVAS